MWATSAALHEPVEENGYVVLKGASAMESFAAKGVDQDQNKVLNPPPGVRTEAIEAGLDARKACIEDAERSWKLREHRRGAPDDADGPLPPTPWCGWGLNVSTAECHGRRRIQEGGDKRHLGEVGTGLGRYRETAEVRDHGGGPGGRPRKY